jgi:hypothetical protein
MGIGVEAIITHRDLALVGDVGGHPGNELRVVHPLLLFGAFSISVADLAVPFIDGEAFQREHRSAHVFPHPLGLFPGLGPDLAVDVEAGVPPGENAFRPFRAQKLPADKIGQDLAVKE